MTTAETSLLAAATIMGAIAGGIRLWSIDASLLNLIVGALIAADLFGGVVCNAMVATKRWYHRSGQGVRQQFGFIAPHLLHIPLVAWLFRGAGLDFAYVIVTGGSLMMGAAAVIWSPPRLKMPVAVCVFLIVVAIAYYGLGLTHGLEWFEPVLFMKLLVAHLVPLQVDDDT